MPLPANFFHRADLAHLASKALNFLAQSNDRVQQEQLSLMLTGVLSLDSYLSQVPVTPHPTCRVLSGGRMIIWTWIEGEIDYHDRESPHRLQLGYDTQIGIMPDGRRVPSSWRRLRVLGDGGEAVQTLAFSSTEQLREWLDEYLGSRPDVSEEARNMFRDFLGGLPRAVPQ
jgi:hypothetical protein